MNLEDLRTLYGDEIEIPVDVIETDDSHIRVITNWDIMSK